MINKEQILQTAKRVIRQQKLPVKIRSVEEGTDAVTIRFVTEKKVPLKNLARNLEFELNLPIKLERIPKEVLGKIGKNDVLGQLGCCATFSPRCLFRNKYGCGYGFESGVNGINAPMASTTKEKAVATKESVPETPKPKKKKRRKMIRRLVV